MNNFSYYVTYVFTSVLGRLTFGSFRYLVSKKVESYEDIERLKDFIQDNYTQNAPAMVLNWVELKEDVE